jgi:hypothetical protein
MPYNPYFETNDRDQAIEEAVRLGKKSDVTVYVVDRKLITMYEEIFIYVSTLFKRSYRRRCDKE